MGKPNTAVENLSSKQHGDPICASIYLSSSIASTIVPYKIKEQGCFSHLDVLVKFTFCVGLFCPEIKKGNAVHDLL